MALLFAADRMDHLQSEVIPNLNEGITVISDRYDHSSVAYQSLSGDHPEGALGWVQELNRHARRPDLTIVLDVKADECARRRASRSAVREMYETEAFQARLATFYERIEDHFVADHVVHVDANGAVEQVAAAIMEHTVLLLGEQR
jgi:dTMP kinase